MKMIDTNTVSAIQQLMREAGSIAVQKHASVAIQYKADRSPVTDVELEIDRKITGFLRQEFPDTLILSEESGLSGKAGQSAWILDPIDGTRVYINGLPTWGILLGLIENGRPTYGFFYMPRSNDFYLGTPQGAYLNGNPLPASPLIKPDDRLAFLAAPTNFHLKYKIDFPRIRALGSTAANFCYCAQGAAIGVLTRNTSLWDVAGVMPIIQGTGLACEFLSGKPFDPQLYLDGKKLPEELLVGHPQILPVLRSQIHAIG
jgi:fructose-1,6-bisphosphatase/inositol monophosphatase family enzyme